MPAGTGRQYRWAAATRSGQPDPHARVVTRQQATGVLLQGRRAADLQADGATVCAGAARGSMSAIASNGSGLLNR
jgi:hypothetical protein